jgi:hypothetical protein
MLGKNIMPWDYHQCRPATYYAALPGVSRVCQQQVAIEAILLDMFERALQPNMLDELELLLEFSSLVESLLRRKKQPKWRGVTHDGRLDSRVFCCRQCGFFFA